jgi:hypothetical protein
MAGFKRTVLGLGFLAIGAIIGNTWLLVFGLLLLLWGIYVIFFAGGRSRVNVTFPGFPQAPAYAPQPAYAPSAPQYIMQPQAAPAPAGSPVVIVMGGTAPSKY